MHRELLDGLFRSFIKKKTGKNLMTKHLPAQLITHCRDISIQLSWWKWKNFHSFAVVPMGTTPHVDSFLVKSWTRYHIWKHVLSSDEVVITNVISKNHLSHGTQPFCIIVSENSLSCHGNHLFFQKCQFNLSHLKSITSSVSPNVVISLQHTIYKTLLSEISCRHRTKLENHMLSVP